MEISLPSRLRARRRWRPESTFRRGLFEQSEFPRHLIRGGGGGTPESLLLRRLGGAAHGRKWFWFLKGLFKKFPSKAARREKPEAYGEYVEGFEQGERS